MCTGSIAKSLASLAERADGLRTVDLRAEVGWLDPQSAQARSIPTSATSPIPHPLRRALPRACCGTRALWIPPKSEGSPNRRTGMRGMTAPTNFSFAMMRAVMSPAGPARGPVADIRVAKCYRGLTAVSTLIRRAKTSASTRSTTRQLSPTTSRRQCHLSKGSADVIAPKPAHMKCSKATAEPRRSCRVSEQAGDQGLVQRSRLSAADRPAACSVMIALEGQ